MRIHCGVRRIPTLVAAAALGVLAVLGGCSSGGSTGASSPAAPSTVPAGAGHPPVLAPDGSSTTAVGDTATYHGSRTGRGWTAVDAEVCASARAGTPIDVSAASWHLVAADGRAWQPTAAATPGAPTPRYPDAHIVPAGHCLRAWAVYAVGPGTTIARVVYQPDSTRAPLAAWTPAAEPAH